MGNLPSDPVRPQPVPIHREFRCDYCGCPLNPNFYFCLACATPYQSVEMVVTPPTPVILTEGMLIRKKAPVVWPMFWTFFSTLVGLAVLGLLLFDRHRPDLAMLLEIVGLTVVTCVFAAMHWRSLVVQFKRIGFDRWEAWAALGLLVPALGINFVYHGAIMRLVEGTRDDALGKLLRETGFGSGAIVLLICAYPAIFEEIAFRGLIQHWLQAAVKPMRAVVLAAGLFTVMHLSIVSAPYLFGLGVLLGWAKLKTGSLYPSMLIHFLHNLVVVMFILGW